MLISNRARHELNHCPKQTYRCKFPNCTSTFVREDLLKRHTNRHAAKGSRVNQRASIVAQSIAPDQPSQQTQPPSFKCKDPIDYLKPQQTNTPYETAQIRTPNSFVPTTCSPTGMYPNRNISKRIDRYVLPSQVLANRIPQLGEPQLPSMQRPYASAGYSHFNAMPSIADQQGFTIQQNMAQLTFFSQQNVGSMDWPLGQYVHGLNPAFVTSEPRIHQPGDKRMISLAKFPNMTTSHFDNPLAIQAQHKNTVSTLISHTRSQDAAHEDKPQKHQQGHRKIERGEPCGRGVSDKICYTLDNSHTS